MQYSPEAHLLQLKEAQQAFQTVWKQLEAQRHLCLKMDYHEYHMDEKDR
jgi:hypothetical protein